MTTALLAIDCQNNFASSLSTALPNVLRLITAFSHSSLPTLTIFTQHGHSAAELSGSVPSPLVRRWTPEGSIATGSHNWQLLPEIQALVTKDTPISPKNSYDAFVNTGLEGLLTEKGVKRVVVVGCLTDFCCETTAKAAFNRGFETWFVEDACGTESKAMHRRGVEAFGKLCGEENVKGTEEVVRWLEEGK